MTVTMSVNQKPIIELDGANPYSLNPSSEMYSDPGAGCIDPKGGEVDLGVAASSNVILAKPGTYSFRYTCTNEAGTAAVPQSRTIIVSTGAKPSVFRVRACALVNGYPLNAYHAEAIGRKVLLHAVEKSLRMPEGSATLLTAVANSTKSYLHAPSQSQMIRACFRVKTQQRTLAEDIQTQITDGNQFFHKLQEELVQADTELRASDAVVPPNTKTPSVVAAGDSVADVTFEEVGGGPAAQLFRSPWFVGAVSTIALAFIFVVGYSSYKIRKLELALNKYQNPGDAADTAEITSTDTVGSEESTSLLGSSGNYQNNGESVAIAANSGPVAAAIQHESSLSSADIGDLGSANATNTDAAPGPDMHVAGDFGSYGTADSVDTFKDEFV